MQESARLLVALHQNMKGGVGELILATSNSLHHDIQLLMEMEDIGMIVCVCACIMNASGCLANCFITGSV